MRTYSRLNDWIVYIAILLLILHVLSFIFSFSVLHLAQLRMEMEKIEDRERYQLRDTEFAPAVSLRGPRDASSKSRGSGSIKNDGNWKMNIENNKNNHDGNVVDDAIMLDDVKKEIILIEKKFHDGIQKNLDLASKRERDAYLLFQQEKHLPSSASSSSLAATTTTNTNHSKHSNLYMLHLRNQSNKDAIKEIIIPSIPHQQKLSSDESVNEVNTLEKLGSLKQDNKVEVQEPTKMESELSSKMQQRQTPFKRNINPKMFHPKVDISPGRMMITPRLLYSKPFIDESLAWYEISRSLFDIQQPVVSIRGAMSSGTNWLRSLFSNNCPRVPFVRELIPPEPDGTIPMTDEADKIEFDADALYGWKHGLIGETELKMLRENPNHSIVIIVRNAADWMLSVFRMGNSGLLPRQVRAPDILSFQKIKYLHKCPVDYPAAPMFRYYVATSDQTLFPKNGAYASIGFSACDAYSQEADNIVQARTRDYKNWLNAMKILPNQIKLVRYEDLKENPYKVFSELVKSLPGERGKSNFIDYCDFTESTFNPVTSYMKYGSVGLSIGKQLRNIQLARDVSYNDLKRIDETEICEKFFSKPNGTEAYNNLLSLLNLEFEKSIFRYNYATKFPEGPCFSREKVKYY